MAQASFCTVIGSQAEETYASFGVLNYMDERRYAESILTLCPYAAKCLFWCFYILQHMKIATL